MRLLIKGVWIRNPDQRPLSGPTDILIEGNTISHIGKLGPKRGFSITKVLYANNSTVIPGLINLHVHVTRRHLRFYPLSTPFRQGAPEIENSPDTKRILWALRNVWIELGEGVTSFRDAGSKHCVSVELREAFKQGLFKGPRLLACGEPIAMTGGHETHRYRGAREADGPFEVKKAVREQLRAGADWIKLMASAGLGGMPEREDPAFTEFSLDELQAGVEEAHKRGRRVMAHAMSDESVRLSLEAGVDCIEHGIYMSEATLTMLSELGRAFVPTLSGIAKVYERERAAGHEAFADLLLERVILPHKATVSQAIKRKVLIGTGTDTLGNIIDEITLLIKCGMTPEQALRAATIDSARILGLESEIGTIEEGKRADLVILKGDPLEDCEAYRRVQEVIFNGHRLTESCPRSLFRNLQNIEGGV